GVRATTPGLTTRPRKNPPSGPFERSYRYSSRKIVLLDLYGSLYSTVPVNAPTVCLAKVQRPVLSQAASGRIATAQRGVKAQRIGSWAANHHALGAPDVSTASVEKFVSKAIVRFSVLCSTIVSDRKRQNLNAVLD